MFDLRDAAFDEIVSIAKKNKKVIFLCNDMDVFSLIEFKKNYPERVINVGVAEQNLINMSAGLASKGYIPVLYGILPFIIFRCFEQIKFNLDSMMLKALIIGIGTGHSFSWDGPTHYGVNDIGLINNLSNTNISNPIDRKTTLASLNKFFNAKNKKSLFLRIEKQKFPDLKFYGSLKNGFRFICINKNSKKLIISSGYMCHKILALSQFSNNVDIIDIFNLNHFNGKEFVKVINKYNNISIVDENYQGSSILDLIYKYLLTKKITNFIPKNNQDLFYGDRDTSLKKFKLLKTNIEDYFR